MRCFTLITTVLALSTAALAGPDPKPPADWHARGVFLSQQRIATLQRQVQGKVEPTYAAYLKLQKSAAAALERAPQAPETWYVPGYYRDAEGHRKAKASLQDDANSTYEMALVYRISGDENYAAAAARIINAWATQVKTLRREDDSTLSFSYHFPAFIFAADLLKTSPRWPAPEQEAFRRFVRDKALPMNTMNKANNWGNWGLVLALASATYLDDRALFEKGIARWKAFIETQIAADGHLIHEVGRNGGQGEHGIWYSHFSLMPQTLAAEIARLNGVDLYEYQSPSGHTLRQAFERLVPWTRQPATFPYFKGDPAKLVSTDYYSYFEILNAHWPNPDATELLVRRRPLTASHCAPDLSFTHGGLLNDEAD